MKKTSHLKFSAAATLPAGFRAAGIVAGLKASGKPDMALFFSDSPAALAGTSNILSLAGSVASIAPAALAVPGIFAGIAVGAAVIAVLRN